MEVQRKRKYLTGKRGEKSPRKKMSSEQRGKGKDERKENVREEEEVD